MANIGNYVSITVQDLAAVLVDFTSIRLYRATSQTGSYTLLTTLTLAAGDAEYSYQDTTGATTSWYHHTYYNTDTLTEGPPSEPYPAQNAPVVSQLTLRRLVADRLGLFGRPRRSITFPGPSGTTTAVGSATTVVCSTYFSARWPTNYWVDWYLFAVDGAAVGAERDVISFDGTTGSTGTWTTTAFATAVGASAAFDLYSMFPASKWNEFLDLGRDDVWMPFDHAIGGVANQREYGLPYWIEQGGQVSGGSIQTGAAIRDHALSAGAGLRLDDQQGGGVVLRETIPANQVWILHGWRSPPRLLSDTDTVVLAENLQDMWVDAAASHACATLAQRHGAHSDDRTAWMERMNYYRAKLPKRVPWLSGQGYRTSEMTAAGGRGSREIHY